MKQWLIILMLLATPLQAAELKEAAFSVHCYDVGRDALDGLPGVLSVSREWSWGREINRVRFDPQQISRQQLEDRLKRAGTYKDTLSLKPVDQH